MYVKPFNKLSLNHRYNEFFEGFRNYQEAGNGRAATCLKYVVLANMLALSDINPFDSREAKAFQVQWEREREGEREGGERGRGRGGERGRERGIGKEIGRENIACSGDLDISCVCAY